MSRPAAAAGTSTKSAAVSKSSKQSALTPVPDSGTGEWTGPTIADETSLCDVVVAEMTANRNPERPILSRIAIIGEVVAKDDPPRQVFDECISVACARVNAEDPFNGKSSSSAEPVGVTGLLIVMPGHFFAVLESEPPHLLEVVRELNDRINVRKIYDGVRSVQICLSVDDVVSRGLPRWSTIEAALPPSQTIGSLRPEDIAVEAVHGLLNLGKMCASYSKVQLDSFLQSVRGSHAQLIPRSNTVEKLFESGLCPTLAEYVGLFGTLPVIRRPTEVVYPMEPPVVY